MNLSLGEIERFYVHSMKYYAFNQGKRQTSRLGIKDLKFEGIYFPPRPPVRKLTWH